MSKWSMLPGHNYIILELEDTKIRMFGGKAVEGTAKGSKLRRGIHR